MEVTNNIEKFKTGYIFGLVASILSFMVCFFTGILVFHFESIIGDLLEDFWEKIYLNSLFADAFPIIGKFAIDTLDFARAILYVMATGFILGLLGTLMSIRKISMVSSVIMVIGGILSLISLIFPGVFLITGGVINIKKILTDLNKKNEVKRSN